MDLINNFSENNLNLLIFGLILIILNHHQTPLQPKQIENMVWEKTRNKRRNNGKKDKKVVRLESRKRQVKNPNFDMLHDDQLRELKEKELMEYKEKLGKNYEYLLEKYQVRSNIGYLRKLNKTIDQQNICDQSLKKYHNKIE